MAECLPRHTRSRSTKPTLAKLPSHLQGHAMTDEARAARLLAKSRTRKLSKVESEWLRAHRNAHARPFDQTAIGTIRVADLGIHFTGLSAIGGHKVDELRAGNVNVAGGWCARVWNSEDGD